MAKKILVADDSEEIRALVCDLLKQEGYEMIESENGIDALNKILKERPDLILLDLIMPELDGFSLTMQLRKNEETKDIPIIIISGKSHLKELFMLNEVAKIQDFIEKPFPPRVLSEAVRQIFKS